MRKTGGIFTIVGGIMGMFFALMWGTPQHYEIVRLTLGIVAFIGGIYALIARVWGFALAGGIVVIGIGAGDVYLGGVDGGGYWDSVSSHRVPGDFLYSIDKTRI